MSVRSLRALGLSAIALCLAAVFGFSVAGLTSRDRSGRQQQRSRSSSQRHNRQRLCQGLSQSPCSIQAALRKNVQPSDPPAAELPPGQLDPSFTAAPRVERQPSPGVSSVQPLLPSLPRPPPLFA